MQEIGFVGLGMMGGPMAANLLKGGFRVTAYDVRRDAVEALAAQGAESAARLGELATRDAVIVMVNDDPQARAVIGELIEAARGRSLVIVSMSTILPETIRELGDRARAAGVGLLDAPVSGGPIVAQLGALAIMVGGERALFERVRPLLETLGRAVHYVGPAGAGLTMKLVNNTVAISSVIVVVAALRLGLAQGLDLDTMVEVIKASSGNTWITDQWQQARLFLAFLRDPAQLASLARTGAKDLTLAAALCAESGVEVPLLEPAIAALSESQMEQLRSNVAVLVEAAGAR